jgi:hypothetical protein
MTNFDDALVGGTSDYRLRLSVVEDILDPANNRSRVTVVYTLTKLSGSGRFTDATVSWAFNVGGVARSGTRAGYNFEGYTTLTLASESFYITHNADGSRVANVDASFSVADGNIGSGSIDSSFPLTDFVRLPSAPSAPTLTRNEEGTAITVVSAIASSPTTITDYQMRWSTDGGASWSAFTSMGTDRTASIMITDRGVDYLVQTRAISGEGNGPTSASRSLFVSAGGKRWTGSAWVANSNLRRWNGSAWVTVANLRRWNGSQWVNVS